MLTSTFAGLAMMGFEIVEIVAIDRFGGSSLSFGVLLQIFYFVFGMTLFGLAAFLWMKEFRWKHHLTRYVSHI